MCTLQMQKLMNKVYVVLRYVHDLWRLLGAFEAVRAASPCSDEQVLGHRLGYACQRASSTTANVTTCLACACVDGRSQIDNRGGAGRFSTHRNYASRSSDYGNMSASSNSAPVRGQYGRGGLAQRYVRGGGGVSEWGARESDAEEQQTSRQDHGRNERNE